MVRYKRRMNGRSAYVCALARLHVHDGGIGLNILLVYYTGTYNTRFLTDRIAERFAALGCSVCKTEIARNTPVADLSGYDYIGLGYPVYAFNAPHPFMKYFKKLKFGSGQKYFIYKNSGETLGLNNASSRKILRKAKKENATFCGEYHFVMPYNIHFEFDREFIKQILEKDEKLMDIMFYNLSAGIAPVVKSNFFYHLCAFFIGIQAIGGAVNSLFYKTNGKCNGCGLCAKNSPNGNIQIKNKKAVFSRSCDMCMRCSFYCPQKAIKIGFLQGWQVNRYYDLFKLRQDGAPSEPYITEKSKGFYKCFIKTFDKIDRRHAEIFGGEK